MPNLRAALDAFDNATASAGGSGGSAFRLRCFEGQLLVGIRGNATAVIDQIAALCASPAGEESATRSVGGTGGNTFVRRCEAGKFVVGMRGRAAAVIDSLVLDCAGPARSDRRRRTEQTTPVGGSGGAVLGPNQCSSDRSAVGLRGRAGAFIDSVQLLCSTDQPATTIETPWVSRPVGGSGGAAATLACASNQAMVGVTVRANAWLDNIAPRCVDVGADGRWIGDSERGESAGGDGGTSQRLECPQHHAVSSVSGKAAAYIDRLRLRCRTLASATTATGGEAFLGGVGGNGGSEFERLSCPGDLVASGFAVRTGAYVDQLKLIYGQ